MKRGGIKPSFANPRMNAKLRRDLPFVGRSAYGKHIGQSRAGGLGRIAGASHGHGRSLRCDSKRALRKRKHVYQPCRGGWGVLITGGMLSIHKGWPLDCCPSFTLCCQCLTGQKV